MLEEIFKVHQSGQVEAAEQQYRDHLAAHPDDADALHLLAILRRQRGDLADALVLSGRAAELAPDRANVQLTHAGFLLHAREFRAARERFQAALRLQPNALGAALGIAQVAVLQGDLDAAQEALGKAERLAPQHPQVLAQRGALAQARGDHDTAVKYYIEAAKRAPDEPGYQANLARSFEALGNSAFAEQALRNAVRIKPNYLVARVALGQLMLRQQRFDEAAAEFAQVLAQQPEHPLALAGRGDIRRRQGNLAGALEDYRAAHAGAPRVQDIAAAYIETLLASGAVDEARAALDAALARTPAATALRRIDLRLAARGGPDAQVAALQAWAQAAPDSLEPREQLAGAYELAAQYDDADAIAREVLARDSRAAFARLILARSALRAGRPDEAQEQLSRMTEATLPPPVRADRAVLRGLARDALGDHAGAVDAWLSANTTRPGLAQLSPLADGGALAAALPPPAARTGDAAPAPTFVVGLPGSGVQMLIALLRHHGARVLGDRFGRRMRGDALSTGEFIALSKRLGEDGKAADIFRDKYLGALRAAQVELAPGVVDWLPFLDVRMAAMIQAAFPAARIIAVERDLRDSLLSWLALGTPQALAITDTTAAGEWLAQADAHWRAARARFAPEQLCIVRSGELADLGKLLPRLQAFLGLDAVDTQGPAIIDRGRGGLPVSLPDGRWQAYAEVLAPGFAPLAT